MRITGAILKGIATAKWLLANRGVAARGHVPHSQLILPASTARKRMFTFKVYTAVNSLGWGCLTSALKELLCGAMEHLWTSITGRKINQTTFTIRIVSILLVYSKIMTMNGMTLIVQTATDLPAKKVCTSLVVKET